MQHSLTSFSIAISAASLAPNSISASDFSLLANWKIICAVVAALLLWAIVIKFAHRRDSFDDRGMVYARENHQIRYKVTINSLTRTDAGIYLMTKGDDLNRKFRLSVRGCALGTQSFTFVSHDLGDIRHLILEHDNVGASLNWHVGNVELLDTHSGRLRIYKFDSVLSVEKGLGLSVEGQCEFSNFILDR